MNSFDIVTNLSKDLNIKDIQKVIELVDKYGFYESARILGYDINHYDNLLLAGRLAIEDLRLKSQKTMKEYANLMKKQLNEPTYDFIMNNHEELQKAIDKYSHLDYDHDWFSANTMITMYSAKQSFLQGAIETPNQTWMRIAIQMYYDTSLEAVIKAYKEMAKGWYTPASPTIFNAGLTNHQMASCFLLSVDDDMESILKNSVYRAGLISKASGGLGINMSRVRHSEIQNVYYSCGVTPIIGMIDSLIRTMNQRRKGSSTVFLRINHIDIEDFINIARKLGDKNTVFHDVNICVLVSSLFFHRVQTNDKWTLFCPARAPQLNDVYGVEFAKLYIEAENDPNILPHHKKVVNARDLYSKIIDIERESGMPYLMNSDAFNLKSNHRHMGYINCSNLCLEIIEYTDKDTIAVCNLHNLSLRMFGKGPVQGDNLVDAVDFKKLSYISRRVVENLNKVIDHNWYPLDKIVDGKVVPKIINNSNKKHRPVGMGVSGFAELLFILDLAFEDPRVNVLNKMIFACMYWNALAQSVQLAIVEGAYESFPGSPTSKGLLQFDLWKEEFEVISAHPEYFGVNNIRKREDDEPMDPSVWGQLPYEMYSSDGILLDTIQPTWNDLKICIMKYGLRNSLLIALMPTASTAQIRRNCESVEAHQNNLYSRKVLKCSYPVLNRYLVKDFEKLNIWNSNAVEYIKVKNGSILGFTKYVSENPKLFPDFTGDYDRLSFLEKKYKTMWEISQKAMLKLAAERGRYVDQSASTNIYIRDCTDEKLTACHLYANMLGLKTLMYYLRQTGGEIIKFTADPSMIQHIEGVSVEPEQKKENEVVGTITKKKMVCTDEICVSCT